MADHPKPGQIVAYARRCGVVYAVDKTGLLVVVPIVSGRLQPHRSDVRINPMVMLPVRDAVARTARAAKIDVKYARVMDGDLAAILPSIRTALLAEVKAQRYEDAGSGLRPWHREAAHERSAANA